MCEEFNNTSKVGYCALHLLDRLSFCAKMHKTADAANVDGFMQRLKVKTSPPTCKDTLEFANQKGVFSINNSTQKNVTENGSCIPTTLLTTQADIINVDKTNQPALTTPDQDVAFGSGFTDPSQSPLLWRLRVWDY